MVTPGIRPRHAATAGPVTLRTVTASAGPVTPDAPVSKGTPNWSPIQVCRGFEKRSNLGQTLPASAHWVPEAMTVIQALDGGAPGSNVRWLT